MRKKSRLVITTALLVLAMLFTQSMAFGVVWEFGTAGSGQNPFTPRGYLIDIDGTAYFLGSNYNNSGSSVAYSGNHNGIDYIDAKPAGGGTHTFYAMTDRNPWPSRSEWIGYEQLFLFGYKDGRLIPNFNSYVNTPPVRGTNKDISGSNSGWLFEISGLELDPGSRYEFGFLRGMQANNGITLVLAEDEAGGLIGYIQQTENAGLTSEERAKYNNDKYLEYDFVSRWIKMNDGSYDVRTVPMRFSVQTYADLSVWQNAAKEAQVFLDGVKEADYQNGLYRRENVESLQALLDSYNKRAEKQVKLMLQPQANNNQKAMAEDLAKALEKAKSDKPEPGDLTRLEALIKEAKELYQTASANIGTGNGQYGGPQVTELGKAIDSAEKITKFNTQGQIDAESEALDKAIKEVKASKVLDPLMRFYDNLTGIAVTAPIGSMPENTKMIVREMGDETPEYKAASGNLSSSQRQALYYRIQFFDGDKEVKPGQPINIQMPIDSDISTKSLAVYYVKDGGALKKVSIKKAGGYALFSSNVSGDFLMAGAEATEEEKKQTDTDRKQTIIAEKDSDDDQIKENELESKKKKKEEFKNPLNNLLKEDEPESPFSEDVRRESNPIYLILIAIAIALAGIVQGVRGFRRK